VDLGDVDQVGALGIGRHHQRRRREEELWAVLGENGLDRVGIAGQGRVEQNLELLVAVVALYVGGHEAGRPSVGKLGQLNRQFGRLDQRGVGVERQIAAAIAAIAAAGVSAGAWLIRFSRRKRLLFGGRRSRRAHTGGTGGQAR